MSPVSQCWAGMWVQWTDSAVLLRTREGIHSCLLSPAKVPKTVALLPYWIEKGWKFCCWSLWSILFYGECIGRMLLVGGLHRISIFKWFLKNVNSLEEAFIPLLLKSAYEVSASGMVMKDGRKSLLILPHHHRDREEWWGKITIKSSCKAKLL